jgi:hypothetical protein
MQQLGRALRATALGLMTISVSCVADRLVAPTSVVTAPLGNSVVRNELVTEIASLKAVLASGDFANDLDKDKDTDAISQRRKLLQGFLETLEQQLAHVSRQRPALFEETREPVEAPACILNGNLNGCFLVTNHSIATDGTGFLLQLTSIGNGSQSAVVNIVDNGSQGTPFSMGPPFYTAGFSKNFTFPAPNCNAAAHNLQSAALHQVSMNVLDVGQVSGSRTSTATANCSFQGIVVTVNPKTIGRNASANVTLSHLSDNCSEASVTSSNSDIATVLSAGNNQFYVSDGGTQGTATITASCDGHSGTTTLIVKYTDDESFNAPAYGGPSDCAPEDTYEWYHNFGDGYWVDMGDVCLKSSSPAPLLQTGSESILEDSDPIEHARSYTPAAQEEFFAPGGVFPSGAGHVTLVSATPSSGSAIELQHRRNGSQILVVAPDATDRDLTIALAAIGAMRSLAGDVIDQDLDLTPMGTLENNSAVSQQLVSARALLHKLRSSNPQSIGEFGKAAALTLDLGKRPSRGKPESK